jgi:hypothetical protein
MKARISPTRRRTEEAAGMAQSTKTPGTERTDATTEEEGTVEGEGVGRSLAVCIRSQTTASAISKKRRRTRSSSEKDASRKRSV